MERAGCEAREGTSIAVAKGVECGEYLDAYLRGGIDETRATCRRSVRHSVGCGLNPDGDGSRGGFASARSWGRVTVGGE